MLHGVAMTVETQIFLLFDFVSTRAVVPWPTARQWHPKGEEEGSGGGVGNGGSGGGME